MKLAGFNNAINSQINAAVKHKCRTQDAWGRYTDSVDHS